MTNPSKLSEWRNGRSQLPRSVRHELASPARKPTRGMDVCMRLFLICVVLCVGSGREMGSSLIHGVLQTEYRLKNGKSGQGPTEGP
jgi:hypothetical protein